jgi:LysR family transcriptional regulator, glycine cleavage system transcriptional activator
MKRGLGRSLPPLDSLSVFECAARHRSFTKAALQLNLTQSAVSRRILDLEQFLGAPLFTRTNKSLALTERGMLYLADIEPLLLRLEQATREASDQQARRDLRLTVTISYCNLWLIPRLPRLIAQHPNLSLEIDVHIGTVDVHSKNVDAAIVATERQSPGASNYRLSSVRLVACASPCLLKAHGMLGAADGRSLAPSDILKLPRVHLQQSPDDWLEFARVAGVQAPGTLWRTGITHALLQMNYQAATAGIGAALLPSLFVEEAFANGTLMRISDVELPQRRTLNLIHRESESVAARIYPFLDWLQSEHAAFASDECAGSSTAREAFQ